MSKKKIYLLTEKQIEYLEKYHSDLVKMIIDTLDSEFRLRPNESANWTMLGQHFIELLYQSDPSAFSGLCKGMVGIMRKEVPIELDAFVLASMAEAHETDNKEFNEQLKQLINEQYPSSGLIYFKTGFLGLGDHFSTMWALRLLYLSGKSDQYRDVVDRALNGLNNDYKVLTKSDDFIGFFLYLLVHLGDQNKHYYEAFQKCLDDLVSEQSKWRNNPQNLRMCGFVAYDLLAASIERPELIRLVEEWFLKIFDFGEASNGNISKSFSRYAEEAVFPQTWLQGWIRTLIAVGKYLQLRRSDYTPVHAVLSGAVNAQNNLRQSLSRLKRYEIHEILHGDLIADVNHMLPSLIEFWKISSYENSVFVMHSMSKNMVMDAILNTIIDELKGVGLAGRYNGDRTYLDGVWENNMLYMRGCKYGIVVFERLTRDGKLPHGPNHNVLVELGFMKGISARILLLYDIATMKKKIEGSSDLPPEGVDLPAVIQGTIWENFSSEEIDLKQLRFAIKKWASEIVENQKESLVLQKREDV